MDEGWTLGFIIRAPLQPVISGCSTPGLICSLQAQFQQSTSLFCFSATGLDTFACKYLAFLLQLIEGQLKVVGLEVKLDNRMCVLHTPRPEFNAQLRGKK